MWNYFRNVRAEMRHVTWPSSRATTMYTVVVILVSIITAVYLGLLDYVLRIGVELFI